MTSFKSTGDVTTLVEMLRYCRPDQSKIEQEFVNKFVVPLPGAKWDKFGNVHVRIGKDPIVAWSCHTDTVHSASGFQLIEVGEDQCVRLSDRSKANCLGADDTAGLWLMVEMIKAKRPGLYIFHRAEEVGTQGSKWIATNTPNMMNGIQACIAFDRRGVDNIITHQRGWRCCSEEFAASLAAKLMPGYKADPSGLYTDSATYVDIVPECTNVSVGYYNEHSKKEYLNIPHLTALRECVLELNVADLVIKRKAGDRENRYPSYTTNNVRTYHGHGAWGDYSGEQYDGVVVDEFAVTGKNFCPENFLGYFYDDNKYIRCTMTAWQDRKVYIAKIQEDRKKAAAKSTLKSSTVPFINKKPLSKLVADHSEAVAAMLEEWGFDAATLGAEIAERTNAGGMTTKQ